MTIKSTYESISRLSVSIPEGRFYEIYAAMPDRLKRSLVNNNCAFLTNKEGESVSISEYFVNKNSNKNK